ncbi:MAG: YCII-related protein [Actinomycetia bacterium]|nr:YCII-related protein [Actinomycetes bacterium]
MKWEARRGTLEGETMAQYLILIYEDEARWEEADPELAERVMKDHESFVAAHGPVLRGGSALHPASTATAVRRDASGAFAVTDGAFAETKEAVGGYYLIEVADLDEALAVAKRVPAPFGGVEVRPVRGLD